MPLIALPFPLFTNGTPSDGGQITSDFSTIVNAINGGIDNANIGTAGIFASQIKAGSVVQGTFGGAVPYTFPSAVYTDGSSGLSANGIHGGSGSTLPFEIQSHAQNGSNIAMAFDVPTNGKYTWNVNNFATSMMSLSTTGALTITSQLATATPLTIGMIASQSVPGILVSGAASISGNLLQIDLTPGGTHAFGVNSTGIMFSQIGGEFFANTLGATTGNLFMQLANTGNTTTFGLESSVGGTIATGTNPYATVFGTGSSRSIDLTIAGVVAARLTTDGGFSPGNGAGALDAGPAPKFYVGNGSPNGAISAMNGSMFVNRGGTHGGVTVWYMNTSGANTVGTAWTAIA